MKFRTTIFFSITILFLGCNPNTYKGMENGTAWATGSFDSNGERIYYTATSDRGTSIDYTGGPMMGMMMMGGRLACVSCHGTDAKGGRHMMHMEVMDAPDIRWSALSSGHHDEKEVESQHEGDNDKYDFKDFKNSVENGKHPDGDVLSEDMPRWKMSDEDLKDLMNYLKSLQ